MMSDLSVDCAGPAFSRCHTAIWLGFHVSDAPVAGGEEWMKEPYGKAVATRTAPEPWWDGRKGVLQASVGDRAGWVLSREKEEIGASRPSKRAEDNTAGSGRFRL